MKAILLCTFPDPCYRRITNLFTTPIVAQRLDKKVAIVDVGVMKRRPHISACSSSLLSMTRQNKLI
jgi:hypothetical protein